MEWVELGNICRIEIGKTPARKNQEYWKGKNVWISISDMTSKYLSMSKEKITDTAVEETNIKEVPENTVIMSFKLSIGKTAITKIPLFTNEAICAFHIRDKSLLYNEYLYYALGFIDLLKYTDKAVKGKTLNKAKLKQIKIPITHLKAQQKIAKVLDEAQLLIDKRKNQIKLFDNLIESIFYDMFGDPVKNEKGWEFINLSEFGDWASGGTPTRKNKEYFCGNINWFSAGELNSRYVYNSKEKITNNALEKSSAKLFEKDSILVGMYDTAAFKLSILKRESSSNQACANLKCNSNFNIEWVYSLFDIMKPIYLQSRKGIRQKNLSLTVIKNFKGIYPPLHLQNEFALKVERIEKQKQLLQNSLNLMQENYNCLMQRAFKGELF